MVRTVKALGCEWAEVRNRLDPHVWTQRVMRDRIDVALQREPRRGFGAIRLEVPDLAEERTLGLLRDARERLTRLVAAPITTDANQDSPCPH